jgi:imidazolonepropionase-like amidohydrolase
MRRARFAPFLIATAIAVAVAAAPLAAQRPSTWRCKRVLAEDGTSWRTDVVVVTMLSDIIAVRPARDGEQVDRDFGDAWLIPGLIDLHTHLLLRPYDQLSWDEQVRRESNELRTLRAATFARDTLWAGFVAVRDLGTEGADFADVALRTAMHEGRVRGPQLFVATRAIVKQGFYGPDPEDPASKKGAQVVSDEASIRAAVREQVAGGADWIKVYADYRHGKSGAVAPAFTVAELQALVDEAGKAGKPVAAHATTDQGIRRSVEAGVRTIEHGAGASAETLAAMKAKGVVLCPCLAATEAIVRYAGHQGPVAGRLNVGKIGFQRALAAGVSIACGSDAGVFTHGENVRELELMVEYGMTPAQALASATTVAASVLGDPRFGAVRPGSTGFVVLRADPLRDIAALRQIVAVVREGDERAWR